jgi:hypothetical protein
LDNYLGVDEIEIKSEIGELNSPLRKLNIKLIKVDITENKLPQFLLKEEFTNPLKSPAGEHGFRGFSNVPREHDYGKGEIEGGIRV